MTPLWQTIMFLGACGLALMGIHEISSRLSSDKPVSCAYCGKRLGNRPEKIVEHLLEHGDENQG